MDPITRYELAKFEIAQRHEQAARERLAARTGPRQVTADQEGSIWRRWMQRRAGRPPDPRHEPRLISDAGGATAGVGVSSPDHPIARRSRREGPMHPIVAHELARGRIADFHHQARAGAPPPRRTRRRAGPRPPAGRYRPSRCPIRRASFGGSWPASGRRRPLTNGQEFATKLTTKVAGRIHPRLEYPAPNNDCGSRLLRRPTGAEARAAGRSIEIARVQESIRNDPDTRPQRPPRRPPRAAATRAARPRRPRQPVRPPSCTRTRSAPAKA